MGACSRYNRNMTLPPDLKKDIEKFKAAYGLEWDKRLSTLINEEIRRKKSKTLLADFLKKVSGRVKASEKEIFQKLADRS